jgi:hypothetical protein
MVSESSSRKPSLAEFVLSRVIFAEEGAQFRLFAEAGGQL